MDWSKTKTIFIITFLILDIFLAYQFMEKRKAISLDVISESTTEKKLSDAKITYVDLSNEPAKGSFIIGKSKEFNKEDLESPKLSGQTINPINGSNKLVASFKKPEPVPQVNKSTKLNDFVREHILFGDSYMYWGEDKDSKSLLFFQGYKGKTIYQLTPLGEKEEDIIGVLQIFLNDKKEMTGYEQTYLENIEEHKEKQDLILPIKAMEILYDSNDLKPESHVAKVELGYYTFVPSASSQVLAPTWHFVVNDKEHYFVNAIEGQIIRTETK